MVIVAAFAGFFFLRYHQVRQAAFERSVRLLVTGGQALRQAGDDSSVLQLGQDGCLDGVRIQTRALSGGRPNEPCIRFSQILGFVPHHNETFDKTLLIGAGEKVLEQSTSSAAPSLSSLAQLKLIGSDDKPTKVSATLAEIGSSASVDAGSERFQLFCQPITRPARDAEARASSLALCGMLSDARLLRDCLSISPLLVMLLAGIVALVLLVPPFVKTRMLSFTQRVHFFEAFTVSMCLFFWLMLLTLMGEGFYTHATLTADTSARLRALSSQAATSLKDDIEAGTQGLLQLASQVRQSPRVNVSLQGPPIDRVAQPPALPEVEAMAFSGPDGVQVAKWSSPLLTGSGRDADLVSDGRLSNVSERPYFGRSLQKPLGSIYVDSVKTFTSGKTRAVFALHAAAADGSEGVFTITTDPLALRAARLPPGIALAVVNKSGWVVFHSEQGLSNSHNLFDESEDNAELRHGILTGEEGFLSGVRYWGIDHYAYVTTVPAGGHHEPWSVVAFQEAEPVRLVAFRSIVQALLVSAGYAALCVLVLVVYLIATAGHVTWLWPDKCRTDTYWLLAALQLVLSGAALLLAMLVGRRFGGGWALLVPAALPLALLVLVAALFELNREQQRSDRPGAHWLAYACSFGTFWVVSTFVPTHALARDRADTLLNRFWREQLAGWDAKIGEASINYASEPVNRLLSGYAYQWQHANQSWGFKELLQHAGGWAPSIVLLLSCLSVCGLVPWGMRALYLWGVEALPPGDAQKTRGNLWLVAASKPSSPGAVHVTTTDELSALLFERRARPAGSRLVVSSPRSPDEMLKLLPDSADTEHKRAFFEALASFSVVYCREPNPSADRVSSCARRLLGLTTDDPPRSEASPVSEVSPTSESSVPSGVLQLDSKYPRKVRRLYGRICRELWASSRVLTECERNLDAGALAGVDLREAMRRIRDACWSYYGELWNGCSPIEKLTLLQLAEEQFINDKRIEVVRKLLARGVLRRRPMLAPLNDSLSLFVRDAGHEEALVRLETRPDGFSWEHLRAPLLTLFACSAAAFFYTQRALFDTTLVFATSLTGLLPHLGGLLAAAGIGGARRVAAGAAEALTT